MSTVTTPPTFAGKRVTIQISWGQYLRNTIEATPGGLRRIVEEVVQPVVGKGWGSRNSYARLYYCTDPSFLEETEHIRAWLLLTAVGNDATAEPWGLSDELMPPAFDLPRLRRQLIRKEKETRDTPPVTMSYPTEEQPPIAA